MQTEGYPHIRPKLVWANANLILGRALRILTGIGIVLGAETVHHLMDQIEHAHPQRDPLLLRALQTDEERVERVGVLVRLDAHARLAHAAHALGLGVSAPGEAEDELAEGAVGEEDAEAEAVKVVAGETLQEVLRNLEMEMVMN